MHPLLSRGRPLLSLGVRGSPFSSLHHGYSPLEKPWEDTYIVMITCAKINNY